MNGSRSIQIIIIGVIASLAIGACGAAPPAPAASRDQAGETTTVRLRLGTEGDEGRPDAQQALEFARHVQAMSGGTIVIETIPKANGDEVQGGWDQVVAKKVMSGDLDMANVPARAWDTEGVLSLRALHAPFLVTSDELVGRIATGRLAPELLAGLEGVGVTGLALAPESLRHLMVVGDVPDGLEDFAGMLIRSPRSNTTWALFSALGATGEDFTDPGESEDEAWDSGRVRATESSFALAGTLGLKTTALGNLPLFPKLNALVINTQVYEGLTEDQRRILNEAAGKMVTFAVEEMPDTVAYAEEYCRNGGEIVLADDAFLAEIHGAVVPVYAELSKDAATDSLIGQIRDLRDAVGAEPPAVAPCGRAPAPVGGARGVGPFPEGIFRAEVSLEALLIAGVDRPTAVNHQGQWTMHFEDGKFIEPTCPGGTYEVIDGRVRVTLGPSGEGCGDAAGKVLFEAGWTFDGDELTLLDVRSGHGFDLLIQTLFGRTFTKIG